MIAIFASACSNGSETAGDAEIIFKNAKVYTVEESQPWADAVAIADGKIIAVGDMAAVEKTLNDETQIVDLQGRLLMPAFGDSHVHPVFGGIAFSRCSLHKGESIEDYQEIITGCVADSPGDETVYGVGWEDSLFPPNGVPNKEILDQISTDRVLIFESAGGHTYWVNSKALEVAGIDKDTPDPENGIIDRDQETGEPVGGLQESAMKLVGHMVPEPSDKEMQDSILYVANMFNSLGITSWHDAGIDLDVDGNSKTLSAYKEVIDRGDLTAHVSLAFKWDNAQELEQIPVILEAVAGAKSWGLQADSVKFYLDGVIPQRTAAMIEPYEGAGDIRGEVQIEPEVLSKAVANLQESGIQSHVHAIGDRGVRVALDAFDYAKSETGAIDRPLISHLNVIDPADQERFGPIGAIAVFQPTWASNYPYMDLTKQAIGPIRSEYIYPSKGVLNYGGMIAFGGDWPVATADPLLGLEVAVTRTNFDDPDSGPLLAEQAITLEQAIEAHTLNVAYANNLDKITGSIAPGKSADLIVLDSDIFEMPAADISEANVILTLFKGRPVHGKIEQFNESE
ncbi:amidohydrolase [Hyphococcus sp. DH-69]|uniref:amidohydrolase n=1 Tax=Hyphococcus formosus TaxID=3143534 RepID=UPI00398B5592